MLFDDLEKSSQVVLNCRYWDRIMLPYLPLCCHVVKVDRSLSKFARINNRINIMMKN